MLELMNSLRTKASRLGLLLTIGGAVSFTGCKQVSPNGPKPVVTTPQSPAPLADLPVADGPAPSQKEEDNVPVSLPADTSADPWSYKLANLETIDAVVVKGDPSKARVTVRGLLHDGATRINEVQQQRIENGYVLTVTTARPRKAVASVALIPFERTVTVDLKDMPSGPCQISANGLSTTVIVPRQ